MNYPLRLVKTADGLWEGESQTDKFLLAHLADGMVAVKESELSRLRFLAATHGWQLLLPGEQFQG
ncbi:MAG: hypothetical protein QM813_09385 [Verrucomicrobiota bacterium]